MENFEAECNEKAHNVKKALEAEVTSLKEHVRECTMTITTASMLPLVYRILNISKNISI